MNLANEITLKVAFRDLFPEVAVYFKSNFIGYVDDEGVANKLTKILHKDIATIEEALSLEAQNLLNDYHYFVFHKRIPQTCWLNEQLDELMTRKISA